MFYSEPLQSPISAYNVKRLLGINPDNEPDKALAAGVYPLTETPEGYSTTHYIKENQAYRAIPNEFSNAERDSIYRIQTAGADLKELAENFTPVTTPDLIDEVDGLKPVKKSRAKK